MKIRSIRFNNKKRSFSVVVSGATLELPYSRAGISGTQKVVEVFVDRDAANEAFTLTTQDGQQNTVHVDAVLDYNNDPAYMTEMNLYNLTLEAQRRMKKTDLSTREIIRRMGTSAAQFYRLLDQSNYRKHIDQMIKLLTILDCDVSLVFRDRKKSA